MIICFINFLQDIYSISGTIYLFTPYKQLDHMVENFEFVTYGQQMKQNQFEFYILEIMVIFEIMAAMKKN